MDIFKKEKKVRDNQEAKEEFAKELSADIKSSKTHENLAAEVLTKISIP